MNKIVNGLCALIVAATAGCGVLSKSKNLDFKTATYISPDSNYSLVLNPEFYGLYLIKHTNEPDSTFRDVYESMLGYNFIFCSKAKGDIDTLFNQYLTNYVQMASNGLSSSTPKKLELVPRTTKNITIDNYPAISGGMDILLSPKEGLGDTTKFYVKLTLCRADDRLYTFASWGYDTEPETTLNNTFDSSLVKTFQRLK